MTTGHDSGDASTVLRIFLAMPGTDMGPDAKWASPDQVKRRFYDVIAEKLENELGRKVELVVEKDKDRSGPIYSSMYSEAWTADVYLADLTGSNANVYLELGVRWAMSDGVTILLAQDPSTLKFNAVATRAIAYSSDHDELPRAIGRAVRSIVEGLKGLAKGRTDSPVRENSAVKSVATAEWASLHAELERLRSERGQDYLAAAEIAEDATTKVALLRKAVDVNPLVAESRFQLGRALRAAGTSDAEAIDELRRATHLAPKTAVFRRELGIALSKSGRSVEAVVELTRAMELDPADFDTVSALGGAQRRLALAQAPDGIDWNQLRAARDSYARAADLSPRDAYPLLNVARIDLLLSKTDPARGVAAQEQFARAEPLCRFERDEARRAAARRPADRRAQEDGAYKAFDHADCLLFAGQADAGVGAYREAVDRTPTELRADVLRSVLAGLASIDVTARLDPAVAASVADVRSTLQAATVS